MPYARATAKIVTPRPRDRHQPLPALLGGLAAGQAQRGRDLASGGAGLARPVDQLELALVQPGPGRADLGEGPELILRRPSTVR